MIVFSIVFSCKMFNGYIVYYLVEILQCFFFFPIQHNNLGKDIALVHVISACSDTSKGKASFAAQDGKVTCICDGYVVDIWRLIHSESLGRFAKSSLFEKRVQQPPKIANIT